MFVIFLHPRQAIRVVLAGLALLAVTLFSYNLADWPDRSVAGSIKALEVITIFGSSSLRESSKLYSELCFNNSSDEAVNRIELFADVAPYPGRERIVGITLSKDEGSLYVFAAVDGEERVIGDYKDLSRIEKIEAMDLLGSGYMQIVVYDLYDEMFGAFFKRSSLSVFTWTEENVLRKIWTHNRYQESYSLEPLMKYRDIVSFDYSFPGKGRISVKGSGVREEMVQGRYREIMRHAISEEYIWNSESNEFIRIV